MEKIRFIALTLLALAVLAAGSGQALQRAGAGDPPVEKPSVKVTTHDDSSPARPQPHVTDNFIVEAPTAKLARQVAEAAERHRRSLAVLWLGDVLPVWPERCRITVVLSTHGSGGATSFAFDKGKVAMMGMRLEGPAERILSSALPHEVSHTILAHHFKAPVPRWIDEGAAVLAEPEEEQRRHNRLAMEMLESKRLLPLRRLIEMRDYPSDVMVLYAQGFSLTRFLVEKRDRVTLLKFVKEGLDGSWDRAARRHYGFQSVSEIEEAWREDLGLKALRNQPPSPALPPPPTVALNERNFDVRGKSRFPLRPAPITSLARVNVEKGEVLIALPTTTLLVIPRTTTVPGTDGETITTYAHERVQNDAVRPVPLAEVRFFGTDSKELDRKAAVRELLRREETLVLCSLDGKPVDPFYLRVVKEGTLIVVAPQEKLLGSTRLPPPATSVTPPPSVPAAPPTAPATPLTPVPTQPEE